MKIKGKVTPVESEIQKLKVELSVQEWEAVLCKPCYFGKKIICSITGKIFKNAKEAAFELGYNHKSLCNMLNPKFNHKNITNLNYI